MVYGLVEDIPDGMETYTGKIVRPADLKPGDIDIHDIAHHLALIARHGGASLKRIGVGQHSCMVHDLLESSGSREEVCFAGLMHDAEEAYFGDIIRPIKYMPGMEAYRAMATVAQQTIFGKFEIEVSPWEWEEVKLVDDICVGAEIRQLKRSHGKYLRPWDFDCVEPKIDPWSDRHAEVRFLERFARYRDNGKKE